MLGALAAESACRPDPIAATDAGSRAESSGLLFQRWKSDTRFRGMTTAGIPRVARLLSGVEFKRVFDARQVESNRYFRIHWALRVASDPAGQHLESTVGARLGLAIAKRVARRAVDRNRIRRIARETFRLRRRSLRPADYVVLAKPSATSADSPTLKLALEQLWLRFESQ